MALNDLVNRIKGIFSGGASGTTAPQNPAGNAAGPGHTGQPDTISNLKEQASDIAGKAGSEASKLADQAKHAASDVQQKAEELLDRGQEKAASAAGNEPAGGNVSDKIEGDADSAQSRADEAKGDLTERVDELKSSADAQVDDAKSEFDERRS